MFVTILSLCTIWFESMLNIIWNAQYVSFPGSPFKHYRDQSLLFLRILLTIEREHKCPFFLHLCLIQIVFVCFQFLHKKSKSWGSDTPDVLIARVCLLEVTNIFMFIGHTRQLMGKCLPYVAQEMVTQQMTKCVRDFVFNNVNDLVVSWQYTQLSSLRLLGSWSPPNIFFSKLKEIKQREIFVHCITTT